MIDKLNKILRWKRTKKAKFPLKYYESNKDRYNVQYNNVHLCTCNRSQGEEVQKDFDRLFDGKNIDDVSRNLKDKYNMKIQNNKSVKRKKKQIKGTYRTNKLCFNNHKNNGRLQVKVRHNGKPHTICNCYPHQKDEIRRKYDILKKDNNLETIKIIMKNDYNLR